MAVDGTNLIQDGDKFAQYFYRVTEFIALFNGEEEEIPLERITTITIQNYFELASFPLFKITMALEPSRYFKIIKNKKDVKFKIRIQSYYTTNENTDEKSLLKDVINDTFVFYQDDNNSDYDIDTKKDGNKENDINELSEIDNIIEFFFFKEEVTSLRSKCNYILKDINLTTALTFLLNKGGTKHVLMSPLDNSKTYSQLILPPQSYDRQIRYLNNNFGFHKQGSMTYFGLFHSYILNCNGEATAYYKKEKKETVIFILERGNTKSSLSGVVIRPKDKEKNYCLAISQGIDIKNTLITANTINGVNMSVIDAANNSKTDQKSNAQDIKKENDNILFNDTSNEFMATTYAAQQKANGMVLTMIIENIDIEIFNPNKKFTILFENQTFNNKYKGTYRICSSLFDFQHSSAEFKVRAVLTFKRVNTSGGN